MGVIRGCTRERGHAVGGGCGGGIQVNHNISSRSCTISKQSTTSVKVNHYHWFYMSEGVW